MEDDLDDELDEAFFQTLDKVVEDHIATKAQVISIELASPFSHAGSLAVM